MNHETAVSNAKEIADRILAPAARQNDKEARFSSEAIAALGPAGLLGIMLPTEVGGSVLGPRTLAAVIATLAEADASAAMVYLMHISATATIAAARPGATVAKTLKDISAGKHLTTLAFSEAGSRSHFWAPVSRAKRNGAGEQRGRNGREASATVENNVREVESDGLRRRVGGGAADQRRVRGLILDGKRLVAYIAGSAPPAIAPLRKPAVFVKTMPDDNVQILGFQFLPGTGERGVTLTIEGETVATNAPVTADEKFEVRVRVRRPPGWVLVSAVQRDGLRTTIATTNLQVVDDK